MCLTLFTMIICLSVGLTFCMDSLCEVCWCRDGTITCDELNVIETLFRNGSVLYDKAVSNVSSM